jgi:hypothetical protein
MRAPSIVPMIATATHRNNSPRTPPSVSSSHISATQIHSPENFRKSGKVTPSFWSCTENYLTNEGIDAIVR